MKETKEKTPAAGHCSCRTKQRSPEEHKALLNRINRIEGQIRGIRGMIEDDAYCVDILTQAAAARSALNSFSCVLMGSHIKTCVADDIRSGSGEKMDELIGTMQRFMK